MSFRPEQADPGFLAGVMAGALEKALADRGASGEGGYVVDVALTGFEMTSGALSVLGGASRESRLFLVALVKDREGAPVSRIPMNCAFPGGWMPSAGRFRGTLEGLAVMMAERLTDPGKR